MRELTMADHAELWTAENGKIVPERNTDDWETMYREWVEYAFQDFKPLGSMPELKVGNRYKSESGNVWRVVSRTEHGLWEVMRENNGETFYWVTRCFDSGLEYIGKA